jgi:outer membrane receptor for ferrienterochelin and colicin
MNSHGLVAAITASTMFALSETHGADDLDSAYGGRDVISLATGYERALFDAPISATTISREDIERSGARSLADLLERVPGYYLTSNDARSTQITVRGLTQRVLILVNNLPLYQGYLNASQSLHDILLLDVERIEVTRGPGSAIYGADASAGIVNIITRTASKAPLAEVGLLWGDLGSSGAYGLYGDSLGNADLRMYGAYYETDFSDRHLQADAQTAFDRMLRTDVSLAPGPINAGRKVLDARASVAGTAWTLMASHRDEYDFGTGTGLTFAIDPTGTYDSTVSTLELLHHSTLSTHWTFRGYLAGIEVDQQANLHLYPAGAFRGLFPDGVRQAFEISETRYRAEVSGTYTALTGHMLLMTVGGSTFEYDTLVDRRNYIVRGGSVLPTRDFANGAGVNDAEIVRDATRDIWYGVLQDEWTPISDWTLTLGVRFDRYSDFGDTVNPRAAVVWSPTPRTSVKLLYGTAFRPPAAMEQQSNGTFSALGNPQLKPVRLAMSELSISHRTDSYRASAGVFQYRQRDLVQTVPAANSPTGLMYQNRDTDSGWGAEVSVALSPISQLSVEANYAYQEHTGSASDNSNAQQAPRHQVSIGSNVTPWPDWRANLFALFILDRGRASSDPRPPPPDYTLVNLMIERTDLPGRIDASISIHNLFDRRIDDPSDSPTSLAADIPVPGRTWLAQLRRRF